MQIHYENEVWVALWYACESPSALDRAEDAKRVAGGNREELEGTAFLTLAFGGPERMLAPQAMNALAIAANSLTGRTRYQSGKP